MAGGTGPRADAATSVAPLRRLRVALTRPVRSPHGEHTGAGTTAMTQ